MEEDNFLENINLEDFDVPCFIDETKEIEITIWIGNSKTVPDLVYCDFDKEKFIEVAGEDLFNSKEHKIWFKHPSFNDNNMLLSHSIEYTQDEKELAITKLSIERMYLLIKRWTFNQECSFENVRKLSPIISFVLGMALDTKLKLLGIL